MPTVREGNVFPAAGGKKNRLPEGWYGNRLSFVYGGMGMRRECGGSHLVDGTGRDCTIS